MNRKYAACEYTRSAPSYLALPIEISGFSESLIRCCVHIPLRAFQRFRRICRGPGRASTAPWFDRQLQVESQGFGIGEMTISVRPFLSIASARWLMSCARQPYQRSNRLSSSPGGAQTRQTEINYAVARVRFHSSKRLAASIAC